MEYNQTTQEEQFPPTPEINATNTSGQASPFQNQQTPLPTPPKKNNTSIIIAAIVAVVLLILGGGVYYYTTSTASSEQEQRAYDALDKSNSSADFQAFLDRYPNSKYTDDVRERMDEFKQMENSWSQIQNSSNTTDFISFKDKFSNSFYSNLCDQKIDSLDWVRAQSLGTAEAYNAYMEQHPQGRYFSEASIAQGQKQDQEITEAEYAGVTQTIATFYDAFGDNDENRIAGCITPVMEQFLSKKKATKADVMNIISNMFNEHIEECDFNVNNNYNIVKNGNTYNVTFSVDQHITRDNEGKTFGSYQVQVKMDQNFMIQSLIMKEISQR